MTGTKLLIVIDTQNGFITDDSRHVVPVITGLAQRWLDDGGRVVFTRYRNFEGSPYERLIGWNEMHTGPDTELVDELGPLAGHERALVIDKSTYSALTPECLAAIAEHDVTDLYLCGLDTDGCVLATAIAAFDARLTPWVLEDAVATSATSHPEDVHAAGLLIISRLIGTGQLILSAGTGPDACQAPAQAEAAAEPAGAAAP